MREHTKRREIATEDSSERERENSVKQKWGVVRARKA